MNRPSKDPVIQLVLRPLSSSVPWTIRFRQVLKQVLRHHDFRCVDYRMVEGTMEDLFGNESEADKERLRRAGWTAIDYWGSPCWRSPDGTVVLAEYLALARIDREAKQAAKNEVPPPPAA